MLSTINKIHKLKQLLFKWNNYSTFNRLQWYLDGFLFLKITFYYSLYFIKTATGLKAP